MDVVQLCKVIDRCGGCPLLSLPAVAERALKLATLEKLQSDLGLTGSSVELIVGTERVKYRNRIRLRIDDSGIIAFFNSEKSPNCAVLMPELCKFISDLRDWSNSNRLALASFAHLEARAADRDGVRGIYLSHRPSVEVRQATLSGLSASFEKLQVATSEAATMPHQRFDIDGATFQYVPLNGFLQVNFEVNRLLTGHVVRGAISRNLKDFADLYCGAGNFALPLARAGLCGNGVERVTSCQIAATHAARKQGLDGVTFSAGDAIDVAERWLENGRRFDLVVVDPPRAGIREGLDAVAALASRSVTYCSCNPESLLCDLSQLQQRGWQVEQLTGFDMFSGTVHLEVVAWLSRSK